MSEDNVVTVGDKDLLLEPGQDVVLQDRDGRKRLRLDAAAGTISIRTAEGDLVLLLEAGRANLWFGGSGHDGDLVLFPASANSFDVDRATVHLSAGEASLRLGDAQRPGGLSVQGVEERVELNGGVGQLRATKQVDVRTAQGQLRIRLNSEGAITAGGDGSNGRLQLRDAGGRETITLNGGTANGGFGGAGEAGAVFVKDASGADVIILNGETGNLAVGRQGGGGSLLIKDASGADAIVLRGTTGSVSAGRSGLAGQVLVKDDSGQDAIVLRGSTGNIGVGRAGRAGDVFVSNDKGQNTIHLDGQAGDILLSNADCAEEFDIAPDVHELEPGTVLAIDDASHLRPSASPYDRRVAGVVSGAGEYRPGIVLDRRPSAKGRAPIALLGKVSCKVDAGYAPIQAGDLLTTSPTPGHAMKVLDPLCATGAVLGKALRGLENGRGLIPVLVALQ